MITTDQINNILNLVNQYSVYVVLGTAFLNIVLIVWILLLRRNLRKIFKGSKIDLEETLLNLRDHQEISDKTSGELQKKIAVLEEDLPKGIRKIGLVRYNPFSDAGGDQSFALALLNDEKSGVVLSSLYGREMNRVYSKRIEQGSSKYQLTDEEKKAIEEAA